MNKALLLLEIKERFRRLFPELTPDFPGACLYWAVASYLELSHRGYKPLLQAGSMNWPIVLPELDDGVSPTHFSYEYDPNSPLNQFMIATGQLPEMHVWVRLPDTREIIDLTTGFLLEQCTRLTGLSWTAEDPPAFLWTDRLPEGVFYRPDPDAIRYVLKVVHRLGVKIPAPKISAGCFHGSYGTQP